MITTMLKVIIADDEERVSKLVLMIVDWEALGMEVVGIASNGFEAIELVEKLRPDILISDIRMPGCNGLELVEKAKSILPQLQITLISGYAEFEYAQVAMGLDVGGYILKPISKEIITATLEKLGNKCREQLAAASTKEQLIDYRHKSSEVLRGRLPEDLLFRRIQEPSSEILEQKYGFSVGEGLLQVFIVKMDCVYAMLRDRSMDVIKKKIEEVFDSMISPLCEASVFQMELSSGYGIINFNAEKQPLIRRTLREYLKQLEAYRFGGVDFSLAIGKAVENPQKLPESMHDALVAIAERIVEGTGRVLESRVYTVQSGTKQIADKYVNYALRVADMLSEVEANNMLDELTDELLTTCLSGYDLSELVLTIGKMFALRLNMDESATPLREFEEKCSLCGTVSKLLDCLRGFLTEQIRAVWMRLENESIRPIRIAKQYILQHYTENITLSDVCAATGFSVSYFSKMFKKETGEGFSQYLARVRIDQAKELLKDTDLPIAGICEMVGYSDMKHFVTTFKKMTSLKPGQYRKLYG
jgi:two-component system response regulator YesN